MVNWRYRGVDFRCLSFDPGSDFFEIQVFDSLTPGISLIMTGTF